MQYNEANESLIRFLANSLTEARETIHSLKQENELLKNEAENLTVELKRIEKDNDELHKTLDFFTLLFDDEED